jgi:hypothetical protein
VNKSKSKSLLLCGGVFFSILLLPVSGLTATRQGREWILCQALARHKMGLVHWCIEHGARPNCHCMGETNSILLAMDDREMLHYLHIHGGNMSLEEIHDDWSGGALVHAAMNDDLIAVRNLIAEGAGDESGTSLSWAADPHSCTGAEIIRLLKKAGVHVWRDPEETNR